MNFVYLTEEGLRYMDIEPGVLASLIGVAGLAIAAILSSAGYLYRSWNESKRSARKVLYLLLEIRYALGVSLFDADAAAKKYINHYFMRLKSKGLKAKYEEIENQISPIVEEHFSNLAKASETDIQDRLLLPFEEALSNLSQVSPVLAYSLRGKEKLELLAKLNISYLESLESTIIADIEVDWAREAILEFALEQRSETFYMMSKNLDKEITLLAKHCGWIDLYRCKKVLSMKFGQFDRAIYAQLDSLIDKIFEKLITAANSAQELNSEVNVEISKA